MENVIEIKDITYTSNSNTTTALDVYAPADYMTKSCPAIIGIHGGGLFMGTKEYYGKVARYFVEKGYVVFTLDYSHIPKYSVFTLLDEITAGYNKAKSFFKEYNVDEDKVYLLSESAGAYLGLYSIALGYNRELAKDALIEPSDIKFKALCFHGGMFYTNRFDTIGLILSRFMYKERRKTFKKHLNPDSKEMIEGLMPSILVTSDKDFLKKYTDDFKLLLDKYGIENEYVNMGPDKKLIHACMVFHTDYPECMDALEKVDKWFKSH